MIYSCIYAEECPFKRCAYQKMSHPIDAIDKTDTRLVSFDCAIQKENKGVVLTSDERYVCDRNLRCDKTCILKENYITKKNAMNFFSDLQHPTSLCDITDDVVQVGPYSQFNNSCISIW